ncbi:MAG: FAD-dependent oxidoreductase [Polyangiaceae bacterium]
MHVVVAGGGIFGQVIAWRLAVRGARVTVCEPVGPGAHGTGSGDRTRIVRALYDEPHFAEAGHRGLRLWSEWCAQLSARLIEPIGVLYLVRKGGPGADAFATWVERGVTHLRALGAAFEDIPPAAVPTRWPAMRSSDLRRAVLEPAAGYARAALATRTIARAAAATGLVVHTPARVTSIETTSSRVTSVRTVAPDGTAHTLAADAVVIAAGFAGVALLEPLCGRLPIERLPHWVSYWDVPYPGGAALHETQLPCWADLGSELYGFPDDGESGFKAAWHSPRPPSQATSESASPQGASPKSVSLQGVARPETPTESEIEALRERVAARFPPLAEGRCRGIYECAYDSTADETFQIGPVPPIAGLWFAGGLSGHGFKHAPSLGESLAASVVNGQPEPDLAPYTLRIPRS